MEEMTEELLSLTLEIMYLLTGEDYTVVKTVDCVSPRSCLFVSGGWSKTQNPTPKLLPPSLIHDSTLKILKITSKITELLTGEVPVRCQDVTVHFSMKEWEYLEGHKDLYKDVMMGSKPPLTTPDGCSKRNVLERCPSPLYLQHCPGENHSVSEVHQGEDLIDIKVEIIEREEEAHEMGYQQCKEELPVDISPDGLIKNTDRHVPLSADCKTNDNIKHDFSGENSCILNIPSGPENTYLLSFLSNHGELSPDNSNTSTQSTDHADITVLPSSECGKYFTKEPMVKGQRSKNSRGREAVYVSRMWKMLYPQSISRKTSEDSPRE
ncbi:oocyte zinc finger protein XlCOF8.4-like [Bufo gargarizans]|uniref:oocyte zinc finger protein XlCOF8.4-like n=1 Tax=Bufo gargarizans TaxID=30331 RepID=UPI001CF34E31|nr:oocyte zinc finger protein XlCOF8.4-like [Bufo gargarizans]XP_044153155.1 oocyte zinc finger protein XlCOF8.4-like [Bufo gargarizans]